MATDKEEDGLLLVRTRKRKQSLGQGVICNKENESLQSDAAAAAAGSKRLRSCNNPDYPSKGVNVAIAIANAAKAGAEARARRASQAQIQERRKNGPDHYSYLIADSIKAAALAGYRSRVQWAARANDFGANRTERNAGGGGSFAAACTDSRKQSARENSDLFQADQDVQKGCSSEKAVKSSVDHMGGDVCDNLVADIKCYAGRPIDFAVVCSAGNAQSRKPQHQKDAACGARKEGKAEEWSSLQVSHQILRDMGNDTGSELCCVAYERGESDNTGLKWSRCDGSVIEHDLPHACSPRVERGKSVAIEPRIGVSTPVAIEAFVATAERKSQASRSLSFGMQTENADRDLLIDVAGNNEAESVPKSYGEVIHAAEIDATADNSCEQGQSYNNSSPFKSPRLRRSNRIQVERMFVSPPTLTPTPVRRTLPTIRALLKFFSLPESEVKSFLKHLPSKKTRSTAEFWTDSDSSTTDAAYQRTVASNLVFRLLQCISETLCGTSASSAFLEIFATWLNPVTCANDTLVTTSANVLAKTRKGSLEYRSVRALLCGSYSLKSLQDICIDVNGVCIGRKAHLAGCRDFQILLDEGALEVSKVTRQRFDPAVVSEAVRHILSMENVAFLSWGTKSVKLDGERVSVPAIQRRKPINVMFDQYGHQRTPGNMVPARTYYRLAAILTHGTSQPRKAVNYVTGFLINDNFQLLDRIVRDLLPTTSTSVLERLAILREWLKYGGEQTFENGQRLEESHCPRHLIQFGLATPPVSTGDTTKPKKPKKKAPKHSRAKAAQSEMKSSARTISEAANGLNASSGATKTLSRAVSCQQCIAMDTIFTDLRQQLEATNPDPTTLEVVDDAYEKMELYLGHRVRVTNQQRAIHETAELIKTKCMDERGSSDAIIVIDFKMKLEPIYFREKTVDHYGKRGMSWHGALLPYWTYDAASGSARENKVYVDQISNGDNKQDKESVVALVEGILLSVHRAFPFIKRVTFQSDNASCYQNTYLALMLPLVGALNNIEVVRFIHSETQDGKCVLDAHFATATRKVKAWVCQGHDATTPQEVVTALTSDGGLPNCIVELVEYNRAKMKFVYEAVELLAKSLGRLFTRFNEVVYDHPPFTPPSLWKERFDVKTWPSFKLTIFEYSGVGDGCIVCVCPTLGRCDCNTTHDRNRQKLDLRDDTLDSDIELGNFSSDSEDECEQFEPIGNDAEATSETSTVVALPGGSIGALSGIQITRFGQLRMRTSDMRCERPTLGNDPHGRDICEKDVEAYAKRSLMDMQTGGDFSDIIESTGLGRKVIAAAKKCVKMTREQKQLAPGWARRQKKGYMYGAKYIALYSEEVEKLFNRGVADARWDRPECENFLRKRILDATICQAKTKYAQEYWPFYRSRRNLARHCHLGDRRIPSNSAKARSMEV